MIPKIIHYVWVGGAPQNELVKNCVKSWKQYLPEYQVMAWDDDAFKGLNNTYAEQAYEARRWAFVSDYIRLYALYKFGGFYFDSDLEVTGDLDQFRKNCFLSGFEVYDERAAPITALMGAEPGNPIIKALLDDYERRDFVLPDGTLDLTPNTQRISEILERDFGVLAPYDPDVKLDLNGAGVIYPSYFFCTPKDGCENYSIHHFNGSWLDGYSRKSYFRIGGFSLVRLKRKKNKSMVVPLLKGEKLLGSIDISKKYSLMLVKV